ncbi:DUF5991 domain-containing protein [Microbulbifer litoralis]|uniref:DUF5991 domain-containing protein n=1 Tax=Microbulbifer litoralis TaxID=2933965 RepID=UPI002540AF40|nr:DUF5991 domain-containing protein [Microbulbifer sp. GX H0434]
MSLQGVGYEVSHQAGRIGRYPEQEFPRRCRAGTGTVEPGRAGAFSLHPSGVGTPAGGAAGDGAEVRFRSYGNGEVKNIYGVQVYRVDETLFRLRRRSAGAEALLTDWVGLVPDSVEEKSGRYFRPLESGASHAP